MRKICLLILLITALTIQAQEAENIISLSGRWKFSIGDNKDWAQPSFNDQDWETLRVPSAWEEQGFNGYDGFAWYRKSFVISSEFAKKQLYLNLGYIDDADEVYFNGQLIGFSGSMPPRYSTAYDALRIYNIPSNVIKFDKTNTLAIRVYDAGIGGGIINGNIGIYTLLNSFPTEIDLQGIWKFKTGDNDNYSDPLYNDNSWQSITVPRHWEDQGYQGYDGFAWYRKKFLVTGINNNERYVVVLGKIDDLEEVYLNGQFIGPLSKIEENKSSRYDQLRAYYISGKLLQNNKYNVIAVRVKDNGYDGGIYEGYIGIVKQKDFVQYWRTHRY